MRWAVSGGLAVAEYLHRYGSAENVVIGVHDVGHSAAPQDRAQSVSTREEAVVRGMRT